MPLGLLGEHQAANAAVALTAVEVLRSQGWHIPESAVAAGLAGVHWPARMECRHPSAAGGPGLRANNVASAEAADRHAALDLSAKGAAAALADLRRLGRQGPVGHAARSGAALHARFPDALCRQHPRDAGRGIGRAAAPHRRSSPHRLSDGTRCLDPGTGAGGSRGLALHYRIGIPGRRIASGSVSLSPGSPGAFDKCSADSYSRRRRRAVDVAHPRSLLHSPRLATPGRSWRVWPVVAAPPARRYQFRAGNPLLCAVSAAWRTESARYLGHEAGCPTGGARRVPAHRHPCSRPSHVRASAAPGSRRRPGHRGAAR